MRNKLITTVGVLLAIGYSLLTAHAQTPARVILTWQANNFYPADFAGKALATRNTPVGVSAEVLRNGKLADLSRATFIWYVDEKLQSRGEGLKEIVFTATKSVGDSHFVRASIQSGSELFESSIRVPISNPIVVTETPYPNQLVKTGGRAEITAVPYFFNVGAFQDLNFFWQIGNDEIRDSGSDNRLVINIGGTPAGELIQIAGTARNRNNLSEAVTARTRLVTY